MTDAERLAQLDSKLQELKEAISDRVEKLTQKVAAPIDAFDDGLLPALHQGEEALRDFVDKYPVTAVAGAVAAGAVGTLAVKHILENPETSAVAQKLEPYATLAGEALRSFGFALAAGVVDGAIRVVEKRKERTAFTVVPPEPSPLEMSAESLARPL